MSRPAIALIGNPNAGKTTLFNALTGLRQHVGNYPGVTVEKKVGDLNVGGIDVEILDLPGTYSLAARSPDEMLVVDILLGRQASASDICGVVAIVDASNIQRNFYLVSQLVELGLPLIVVLNMMDVARSRGVGINAEELSARLGVPVIPARANAGEGLDRVREAIASIISDSRRPTVKPPVFPDVFVKALDNLENELKTFSRVEAMRMLIDTGGYAAARVVKTAPKVEGLIAAARKVATENGSLANMEATVRYQWVKNLLDGAVIRPSAKIVTKSDKIDAIVTHKLWGTVVFLAVTALVFQSIYAWAAPLMNLLDFLFRTVGDYVGAVLPAGALRSLVMDGVIKGVGSVIMFLPQIVFLFLFIGLLEDCGYMARAAFLMDKLLSRIGLSGKSFIPMLSSFACAVPGIMATRTIENRRDRLMTILVCPLMSCSARLPVYTLMIAAFVPSTKILGGWLGLQGLTLFAMHLVGLIVAVAVVWTLNKTAFRGRAQPFVMELPSYKRPSLRVVGYRVFERARAFVKRAGTVIFAMTIVIWALSYFPRPAAIAEKYKTEAALGSTEAQGEYLRSSFLGQMGRVIEPVVKPIGWDWRVGMAVLASFPAREVMIAVLGTTYNLGANVDEKSVGLVESLRKSTWPDGRQVFTVPVALSIMIFFALCCQCMATVATIRRETNSWGYAGLTFGYMTTIAYIAAFVVYQGTTAFGWGV